MVLSGQVEGLSISRSKELLRNTLLSEIDLEHEFTQSEAVDQLRQIGERVASGFQMLCRSVAAELELEPLLATRDGCFGADNRVAPDVLRMLLAREAVLKETIRESDREQEKLAAGLDIRLDEFRSLVDSDLDIQAKARKACVLSRDIRCDLMCLIATGAIRNNSNWKRMERAISLVHEAVHLFLPEEDVRLYTDNMRVRLNHLCLRYLDAAGWNPEEEVSGPGVETVLSVLADDAAILKAQVDRISSMFDGIGASETTET